MKLFMQKSFRGTSIKDITDAVKVTKGPSTGTLAAKNEVLAVILKKYETEVCRRTYRGS